MNRLTVLVPLALVVVGALLYFGVISKSDLKKVSQTAIHDGKKLAGEITAETSDQPKDIEAGQQCVLTLRRIETAKRQVASRSGLVTGTVSPKDVLAEMGETEMPRCPLGGEYSLNKTGMLPSCSIGNNHTTPESDDHILVKF